MADSEYVIEIAASMPGGEATIAELDALTAQMTGAGKNAEFFQQAIKQVAAELQVAAAATANANVALVAGREEYAGLERAALQANKAVERAAVVGGTMSRAYLEAAEKANAANAAVNAHTKTLDGLEKEAKRAAAEEEKLAQTFGNVKKLSAHSNQAIQRQAESLEKLSSGIGAIPGPIGNMGQALLKPIQGFQKLTQSMGGANAGMLLLAGGAAAVVVAVVAIGVAIAVVTAKFVEWTVGLADAARSAGLATQAFGIMNPELAYLNGQIDDLSDSTAVSKSDLQGLSAALLDAGVETDRMASALETAALAEAGIGKTASAKYIALEKAAHDAQKAVDDAAKKSGGAVDKSLTEKLDDANAELTGFTKNAKNLRGVVEKQVKSLGNQTKKLEENFSELFSGLNIEPVLAGMTVLVDLFDKSSESGALIKEVFETIFQPLIDQAESAAYAVEAFILGFLIGLTKLYIAVKPAIKFVSELFGFEDATLEDTLNAAATAGEYLAYAFVAFAVVQGVITTAIVAVVTALLAIPVAITAVVGSIITGFAEALAAPAEFGRKMLEFSNSFVQIGKDIISGLVTGIVGGAGAVINAITGVARGAINAAKSLLGISSPSKVFEDFGDMTGEGFVQGVEAQNDNAQTAMAEMVEPELAAQPFAGVTSASTGGPGAAAVAPAAGGVAADGGGGAAVIVHLDNAVITFSGVKDAPAGLQQFKEMLTQVMKGDAASLGKSSEEAAA